jgi:hypothetical protein
MKTTDFITENQFIGDDAHVMHKDHEVQMARSDCYSSAKYAIELHKLLKNVSEMTGLDGWVSEKLTLANDYLRTVHEYLTHEMVHPEEALPEMFTAESAEVKFAELLGEGGRLDLSSPEEKAARKAYIKAHGHPPPLTPDSVVAKYNPGDDIKVRDYYLRRKGVPQDKLDKMKEDGVAEAGPGDINRLEHRGAEYNVYFNQRKGMYTARGTGQMSGQIQPEWFHTLADAQDHAEMEIGGYDEHDGVAEGSLGSSPDRLDARTGINISHKTPRLGQTNLGNIPGGNQPGSSRDTTAYMNAQRAERSAKLKSAIKGQLGKHHKPNLPEQDVAEGMLTHRDFEKPDDADVMKMAKLAARGLLTYAAKTKMNPANLLKKDYYALAAMLEKVNPSLYAAIDDQLSDNDYNWLYFKAAALAANAAAKQGVAEGELTAYQKLLKQMRQNAKNDPYRIPRGYELTAHGELVKKHKTEKSNDGVGGLGEGLAEAAQGHTIEAHGIRGMDRKAWHKTFKNVDQMNAWAEKYDAEIHGTRDLEQAKRGNLSPAMEGMAEGSDKTAYPNATVIKSKNGRPIGEIYQDEPYGWGCFHYGADNGADSMSSREQALAQLKDMHDEYRQQGMAEAENKGLYYNVNKRKAAGTSRPASNPKAPTDQAWKDAAKTAKTEGVSETTSSAGMATAPGVGKGPKTGTLFGGSYAPRTPFTGKKKANTSVIKR